MRTVFISALLLSGAAALALEPATPPPGRMAVPGSSPQPQALVSSAPKAAVPPPAAPPVNNPNADLPPGLSRFPETRYAELLADSPFALATPPAAAPAPDHNFAENLKLGGVSYAEDEHGEMKSYVIVKAADKRFSFRLIGNEEGKDENSSGISVEKIENSDLTGKTTVTLKKGGDLAKIEFDEADLLGTPVVQQPGRNPMAPGGNSSNGYGNPANRGPGRPVVIPRPVQAASPGPVLRGGNGYNQGGVPPGAPPQRRPPVRVIPSPNQ